MRLDQAIEVYLNHLSTERNLAKNSLESYDRDLKSYAQYVTGNKSCESIDTDLIQGFLNSYRKNHAEASLSRMIASIRGLHKFLVLENVANSNPAQYLTVGSKSLRLPKTLSSQEMIKLIDSIDSPDLNSTRDKLIFEFLYGTGSRISELVNTDLDDIDID